MLEAIAEKRTDVGPLDGFAYDLLCRRQPAIASQTRVVAGADPVQDPAIMASKGMDVAVVAALRQALLVGSASDQADLRADLCITGSAALIRHLRSRRALGPGRGEAQGRRTIPDGDPDRNRRSVFGRRR